MNGHPTTCIGMPFPQLPPEVSSLVRSLLEPIDIVRSSRVCRAWRAHLLSPQGLRVLANEHQTYSIDDDIVREAGPIDKVRLIHMIEAHHFCIPAFALQSAKGLKQTRGMTRTEVGLAGQYFYRIIEARHVEIIDLLNSKLVRRFTTGAKEISGFVLTNQSFAYTLYGSDSIHFGHILGGIDTVLSWPQDIGDPNIEYSCSGIKAIAGQGEAFVAVRSARVGGVKSFVALLLSDGAPRLAHVPFENTDACLAAILDDDCCVLIAADWTPADHLTLIRIPFDSSKPVYQHVNTAYGEEWLLGIKVRRTGVRDQIFVKIIYEEFLVNLKTLAWESINTPFLAVPWRGTEYALEAGSLCAKDSSETQLSRTSHRRIKCEDAEDVLVNECFIVAYECISHRGTGCPGYHAFCFDRFLAANKLPAKELHHWKRTR